MAVAALVLGIIGILASLVPVVGYIIGIPVSLIALILGVLGRRNAAANNQPTGTATAGLALGIVGLVVGMLMFVACALCVKAANDASKQMANDPQFKKAMDDFQKQMDEASKNQPK